jgi:hypothetical protein
VHSKGEERKVIRAKDAATDADPATEDPIPSQGMPLTGYAPWGASQAKRPLRSALSSIQALQALSKHCKRCAPCRGLVLKSVLLQ